MFSHVVLGYGLVCRRFGFVREQRRVVREENVCWFAFFCVLASVRSSGAGRGKTVSFYPFPSDPVFDSPLAVG